MVKKIYFHLFLLTNLLKLSHSNTTDYSKVDFCALKCISPKYEFENSSCGCPKLNKEACGPDPKMMKMTDTPGYAEYMLRLHNIVRNKLAIGDDRRAGNIGATDMNALVYDRGLEHTAWCWSHECFPNHDKCRITPEHEDAGQNQFIWYDGRPCDETTMIEAVDSWYEEIRLVKNGRACLEDWNKCDKERVGHFAAMVWGNTTHVGCAFARFFEREKTNTVACNIFCNYAPQGNVQGYRLYTLGKPARDCKETHPDYPALCIGEKPVSGEHEAGFATMNFANCYIVMLGFGFLMY